MSVTFKTKVNNANTALDVSDVFENEKASAANAPFEAGLTLIHPRKSPCLQNSRLNKQFHIHSYANWRAVCEPSN